MLFVVPDWASCAWEHNSANWMIGTKDAHRVPHQAERGDMTSSKNQDSPADADADDLNRRAMQRTSSRAYLSDQSWQHRNFPYY